LHDDPAAYGVIDVSQTQHNLKRLEMIVYFTDPETGERSDYSVPTFIHENVHFEGYDFKE
jgi:hypothetical protein